MAIVDFRSCPDGFEVTADVCVVGTGPSGLAVALELLGTSTRVCLVESGGLDAESESSELDEIESVGLRRVPQRLSRARGFGGTSSLWTGRCGVFDAIDYQERSWISSSGWPIGPDDIAPHVDRAAELLGLGPQLAVDRAAVELARKDGIIPIATPTIRPVIYQFSRSDEPEHGAARAFAMEGEEGAENIGALQHAGAPRARHVGEAYRKTLEGSSECTVVVNATVTSVDTDPVDHRVEGVTLKGGDGRAGRVRAPIVVLAAGGIENPRLLLASGPGLGNEYDQVGRFLSDHPLTEVAAYHGSGDRRLRRSLGHSWFDHDGRRSVYTFGIRLDPEVQRTERLLNAAIHLVEYGDRPHAIASLGASAASFGNREVRPALSHLSSALLHPIELAGGIRDRYVLKRPSLATPTRVSFACVVEQVPDAQSRITLGRSRDSLGVPRALVDWRASELEFETTRRFTRLTMQELARLGYQVPIESPWLSDGLDAWRDQLHDAAHPMCATRMSASPLSGVVDRDCSVHGVSGLYVAGGSVFATSGFMNPTLLMTALAVRLGRHLRREAGPSRIERSVVEPGGTTQRFSVSSVSRPAGTRLRVGLVGSGSRIMNFHLPVVRALEDQFELVGVAGRPGSDPDALRDRTGLPGFASPRDLVELARPDLLLVAVTTDSIDHVNPALIELGIPLVLETPFCWSLRAGRRALAAIRRQHLFVGVVEQFPFLPLEQLKRRVIELGLIGAVTRVENARAFYDYHGIAALRAYLVNGESPRSVVGRMVPSSDVMNTLHGVIDHGQSTLVHCFDRPLSAEVQPDFDGTVTVRGTSGTIEDDRFTFVTAPDTTQRSIATRNVDSRGRLVSLDLDSPIGELRWENPFADHDFDDERIAIASLLTANASALVHRTLPPYSAVSALADVEQLAAMRFSASRGGRPTSPHPRPLIERVGAELHGRIARRRG